MCEYTFLTITPHSAHKQLEAAPPDVHDRDINFNEERVVDWITVTCEEWRLLRYEEGLGSRAGALRATHTLLLGLRAHLDDLLLAAEQGSSSTVVEHDELLPSGPAPYSPCRSRSSKNGRWRSRPLACSALTARLPAPWSAMVPRFLGFVARNLGTKSKGRFSLATGLCR